MKRIIVPKPELFTTYCPECRCVFEYEQEDVLGKSSVECPKCDHLCDHSFRNIKR